MSFGRTILFALWRMDWTMLPISRGNIAHKMNEKIHRVHFPFRQSEFMCRNSAFFTAVALIPAKYLWEKNLAFIYYWRRDSEQSELIATATSSYFACFWYKT